MDPSEAFSFPFLYSSSTFLTFRLAHLLKAVFDFRPRLTDLLDLVDRFDFDLDIVQYALLLSWKKDSFEESVDQSLASMEKVFHLHLVNSSNSNRALLDIHVKNLISALQKQGFLVKTIFHDCDLSPMEVQSKLENQNGLAWNCPQVGKTQLDNQNWMTMFHWNDENSEMIKEADSAIFKTPDAPLVSNDQVIIVVFVVITTIISLALAITTIVLFKPKKPAQIQ